MTITTRLGLMLALSIALVPPAIADVTLTQKSGGKGMGMSASGEAIQYIKGTRMRTDQTVSGDKTSVIIDAAAQRMTVINHRKREAEVHDMAKVGAEMRKIASADIEASVTPTGQSRQVAGATCAEHDMRVAVPMAMGNEQINIVMSGPVCLVKGGPGEADYAAFYRAAAEKGLFFGDPRAAKAQPGQARGMTELYRQMASRGVPYASDIRIQFEGSGMMATMLGKMGGMTMTNEVVSVSPAPIADSAFEIPAGYKQKGP